MDDDKEKYLALLRDSEERKASLLAVQDSLRMLKELHTATMVAFREELTRAIRERVIAEANADVRAAADALVLNQQEVEARANVKRIHGQFRAVFNALHNLAHSLNAEAPNGDPRGRHRNFVTALEEAHEVLAVAAEYLD